MAVSMNANSMRADFMISDAALPQRIEELAEEQSGMFAKLLSDIGDANSALTAEVSKVVEKYSDLNKAGEAAIYRDKETGNILPEDPRKLVAKVLKGEVKIENIPNELITPEFIKLLAVMKKSDEFKSEDDEDGEDTVFDPTQAIAAEQNFQQELSSMMLMELYQIMEKHNEREAEDKVTMLDGISEFPDAEETLPSPVTAEQHSDEDDGLFAELIDNIVETVTEGLEAREEVVRANADVFVPSETTEPTEVQDAPVQAMDDVRTAETVIPDVRVSETAQAAEKTAEAPKTEEKVSVPTSEKTVEKLAAEITAVPETAPNAETSQVIRQDIPVEVNAAERVNEAHEANVAAEQPAVVQTAVSQNEQTEEAAVRQTVLVEEFSVKTVKTETKPEVAENVVQKQDAEESVVVKAVTRNDNAAQLDKNVPEEPKQTAAVPERIKSATEELEMLKNAKAKTAKPVVEEKTESASEVVPKSTAQPLNADSPVVFRRTDGSEIEVRPSEIIRQAEKLVEEAISDNSEKDEYSLVLNPEELGKITVKMTKAADGAVSVTIAAENARTQRILEQNSDLMQSNLRSNGVNLESWQTVNERQQETAAQDYNGSSKNPYYRSDDGAHEEKTDDASFADIIASM